ncbi:MAG: hypothetical protein JKX98_09605 [Alcanivoracaceae bacterium]|nr:hypothetical protein [Alcanivoracaceae bacterium]
MRKPVSNQLSLATIPILGQSASREFIKTTLMTSNEINMPVAFNAGSGFVNLVKKQGEFDNT